MANVEHSTLTGADLHECKGADLASANSVLVADGAGSTTWHKITANEMDQTAVFGVNRLILTTSLTDVSTAGSAFVVVPCACTLNTVYTCLEATIATADSTVTIYNNGGALAGTITVAFTGSTAGDVDSVTAVTNNTFVAGDHVKITTDGASSNTARLFVTLVFTMTGAIT